MALIMKASEKFENVISLLNQNFNNDEFIHKFIELYPAEWNKVQQTYFEHEKKSKGKRHPMPKPKQYILNVSHKLRKAN